MSVRSHLIKSSAVAEMGDRGRAKWAEKWGGCCATFRGGAGSSSNTVRLGRGLPPYQVASWFIQPFGHHRHGPRLIRTQAAFRKRRKCVGDAVLLSAGSPSNTMWPGLRSTSVPSGIFTHPTVWPQYTNVTRLTHRHADRQDRQRSDSIGRTVLRTVAHKGHIETPRNFLYMLTVYVARSSSDDNAIRLTLSFGEVVIDTTFAECTIDALVCACVCSTGRCS